MQESLDIAINETQDVLAGRLRSASGAVPVKTHASQDFYQLTNAFLASTSKHLAAVNAVLLPAARQHLPDGASRGRAVVRQCRRLEVALAQAKARLYGEAHAINRRWVGVWDCVRTEFEASMRLERQLVDDLISRVGPQACALLAARVYRSELTSPTRPHPYTPHTGFSGRVARRAWATADRFWDAAEGRAIPGPVVAHGSSGDPTLAIRGGGPARRPAGRAFG